MGIYFGNLDRELADRQNVLKEDAARQYRGSKETMNSISQLGGTVSREVERHGVPQWLGGAGVGTQDVEVARNDYNIRRNEKQDQYNLAADKRASESHRDRRTQNQLANIAILQKMEVANWQSKIYKGKDPKDLEKKHTDLIELMQKDLESGYMSAEERIKKYPSLYGEDGVKALEQLYAVQGNKAHEEQARRNISMLQPVRFQKWLTQEGLIDDTLDKDFDPRAHTNAMYTSVLAGVMNSDGTPMYDIPDPKKYSKEAARETTFIGHKHGPVVLRDEPKVKTSILESVDSIDQPTVVEPKTDKDYKGFTKNETSLFGGAIDAVVDLFAGGDTKENIEESLSNPFKSKLIEGTAKKSETEVKAKVSPTYFFSPVDGRSGYYKMSERNFAEEKKKAEEKKSGVKAIPSFAENKKEEITLDDVLKTAGDIASAIVPFKDNTNNPFAFDPSKWGQSNNVYKGNSAWQAFSNSLGGSIKDYKGGSKANKIGDDLSQKKEIVKSIQDQINILKEPDSDGGGTAASKKRLKDRLENDVPVLEEKLKVALADVAALEQSQVQYGLLDSGIVEKIMTYEGRGDNGGAYLDGKKGEETDIVMAGGLNFYDIMAGSSAQDREDLAERIFGGLSKFKDEKKEFIRYLELPKYAPPGQQSHATEFGTEKQRSKLKFNEFQQRLATKIVMEANVDRLRENHPYLDNISSLPVEMQTFLMDISVNMGPNWMKDKFVDFEKYLQSWVTGGMKQSDAEGMISEFKDSDHYRNTAGDNRTKDNLRRLNILAGKG